MTAGLREKREGQRVATALPVYLKSVEGVTRDVSASGIFFWTSDAVCVPGELISFSVNLERPDGNGRMTLKCQGDVVRTVPHGSVIGVAVKFTDSMLVTA